MLNSKQRKCIELLLEDTKTHKEIAEIIGVSAQTISNWKKNEEFNAEYAFSLKRSMNYIAPKAFKTEVALLSARSEMVRLMAAKDLLDRAGFVADENVNMNLNVPVIFQGEDKLE